MSRGATLSIMGLYNQDPTVLDLMQFPEDFTDTQKQNVKDNILVECAELEFLYPAPLVAKNIIGIWSKKEVPYWDRVYKASLLEYNPIENYRRNETETIEDGRTEQHSGTDKNTAGGSDALSRTGSDTNTESGTETFKKTGTDTDTESGTEALQKTGTDANAATGSNTTTGTSSSTDTHSGSDTVLNKITGFDSNTLVSHDESDTTYGHVIRNSANGSNTESFGRTDTVTHNTTDTTTFGKIDTLQHNTTDTTTFGKVDTLQHNSTDTTTYGKTDTFLHGEKIEHEGSSERSVEAYGNIGVTTSQEMLTQEMEIAKMIQVVPIIIESFKNRFCLMVY